MNTEKFQFTIGVTEGYFHNNENSNVDFAALVDLCAKEVEEKNGLYIAFNIMPSVTVYKCEWGCPTGGENTYTLSAIRNPIFNDNELIWRHCCRDVMLLLKKKLKQETVTCEFSDVNIDYYRELMEANNWVKSID